MCPTFLPGVPGDKKLTHQPTTHSYLSLLLAPVCGLG